MLAYLVIGLIAGFLIGAESCSTYRAVQALAGRYRAAQQAQESAQRALAVLAGQYRS
jgi:hypothetical protein